MAYHFEGLSVAFVGDALFTLGCGRMFEGTASQFWASLDRLRALPDETQVYCAHEYTQSNARFAKSVEPSNQDLLRRCAEVDAARAQGRPTVPTTIGDEKRTNPFLRAGDAGATELRASLGVAPDADPVAVFAAARKAKDVF